MFRSPSGLGVAHARRVLLCEDCGGVEVCSIPIGTRECKTKRRRLSPGPLQPVDGPAAADADAAAPAAIVAADVAVAEHSI